MSERQPGPIRTTSLGSEQTNHGQALDTLGGSAVPGPIGRDMPGGPSSPGPIGAEEADDIPTCDNVDKQWDTTARVTTPKIIAHGAKLADVKASLDETQGDEWGEGGGKLAMDQIKGVKRGETFTVTLRGTFINRVPTWQERDQATSAARDEWDRFVEKLSAHEECHVDLAVKAFEKLANELRGKKITEVNGIFNQAKADLEKAQKDLDDKTDHGRKSGVKCGDALLDASIQ